MNNLGRAYSRSADPIKVNTHGFPDKKLGKAMPYGVYGVTNNEAGESVGVSSDTSEFAVDSTLVQTTWNENLSKSQGITNHS